MAIYKIFPTADATIYSSYPTLNSGLDEIIEANTTTTGFDNPNPQTSRFLLQFSPTEISDVLTNKITTLPWLSSLRLFIANSTGLTSTTTLGIYPISSSWNMGTGRFSDSPSTTNGVSWTYRASSGSSAWATSGFSPFVTASYSSSNAGGGTWYTASSNPLLKITQTQSFSYYDDKDINVNVTDTIKAWVSGTFNNNGFIVKQENEFSTAFNSYLKYFSRDTNTIYPPYLEFKWRDYSFNTGSSIQTIVDSSEVTLSFPNNTGHFHPEAVQRFRVNSRPKYPERIFQTASLYVQNYYLPTASYYAIKDLDTNEYVIDFDNNFTQISADSESSYFDVYMNGLEPERYYKLLVKTIVNSSTIIFDDNYFFKVING
jgi:hypothetical protein